MGFFCNTDVAFDASSFQHDKNQFHQLLCPELWSMWCGEPHVEKRQCEIQGNDVEPRKVSISGSTIVDQSSACMPRLVRCVSEETATSTSGTESKDQNAESNEIISVNEETIKSGLLAEEPQIELQSLPALENDKTSTENQNKKRPSNVVFTRDKRRRLSSFILTQTFFEDHILDESFLDEEIPDPSLSTKANNWDGRPNSPDNDQINGDVEWNFFHRAMERTLQSRQLLVQQLSGKR